MKSFFLLLAKFFLLAASIATIFFAYGVETDSASGIVEASDTAIEQDISGSTGQSGEYDESKLPAFLKELNTKNAATDEELPLAVVIIIMIVYGCFLVGLGIFCYCVESYGLSCLAQVYEKREKSPISWVPFARQFDIVSNATKSQKMAYMIVLGPITSILAGAIVLVLGLIIKIVSATVILTSILFFLSVLLIIAGFLGFLVMHIWKAFVINNYIKGDLTSAFGLTIYTPVVIWYTGLMRKNKKCDVIGILGFVVYGLTFILPMIFYIVMAIGVISYLASR